MLPCNPTALLALLKSHSPVRSHRRCHNAEPYPAGREQPNFRSSRPFGMTFDPAAWLTFPIRAQPVTTKVERGAAQKAVMASRPEHRGPPDLVRFFMRCCLPSSFHSVHCCYSRFFLE